MRDCAVSSDGTTIVAAFQNRKLRVWNAHDGERLFILHGHGGQVRGCAISADGTTIVSCSTDKTLKVWDGRRGVERFTLKGHAKIVTRCAVSADGATIISVSDDQTLKVWDGLTQECLATFYVDGTLSDCDCSANGDVIAAAGARGIYFLFLVR